MLGITQISPRETPSALGEKPRLCWELDIKEKIGQRLEIYKQHISFFYFHFKYRLSFHNQGIPSLQPQATLTKNPSLENQHQDQGHVLGEPL